MKKILFIGIDYYNYTKEIIKELELQHHIVKFYPIDPRTLSFQVLRNISQKMYLKKINKYHQLLINEEKNNQYDIVLFLQVHQITIHNLISLKENNKQAKFILYNWDSIKTHNYKPYISLFDFVATFDPNDAKELKINYIPLYCTSSISKIQPVKPYKYDVYFIGSIGSIKRYKELVKFNKYCKSEGIKYISHLFCSPIMFIKLILKGYIPLNISFFPISSKKFIDLLQNSKAVFDFSNHDQNGYTMRIFENLCISKKIITSNKKIREEYFYSPDRILIINDSNFYEVKAFLEVELKKPLEKYSEFHLNNWIIKLINNEK